MRTRFPVAAAMLAAYTGLTGCAAQSSTTTRSAPASITAASLRIGLDATHGKAGAANSAASPVTIGFINDDGIDGFEGKSFVNAFQSAVAFVNHDLGGIRGHPIHTRICEITQSEEQGTTCAQEMLNDPSIRSIVGGAIPLGDTEILNTLGGRKPFFVAISSGQADATSPGVFSFNGGVVAAGSILTYTHDYLKARSVSIIGQNEPVTTLIIGLWKDTLHSLGIPKVTTSQFGIDTTDLTATIAASGASTSDALLLAAATTPTCRAVAQGLIGRPTSKPTVALGTCADPSIRQSGGGDIPRWTYYFPYKNTQAPDPTGQVATYVNAVARYGNASLAHANLAPTAFATVIDLVRILNGVGPAAKASAIAAATRAYTGPVFLGPDRSKFGRQPYPSLGTSGGRFYRYDGNGKWTDETAGKWIEPAPPS